MKACWRVLIRNAHRKAQAETSKLYVSFFRVFLKPQEEENVEKSE